MYVRTFLFCFCLQFLITATSVAQQEISPFDFARETDIQQQVGIQRNQLNKISQLQPACDQLCQARIAQTFQQMNSGLQQEFQLLTPELQAEVVQLAGVDIRETVELSMLGNGVLSAQQMKLFEQMWVREAGLNALTSGKSSRDLGMSNIQINQIQNIQNSAVDALTSLASTPGLSLKQINIQTQNIQINMLNQCAAVLTPEQQQQFMELTGQGSGAAPATDTASQMADANMDSAPGEAQQSGLAQQSDGTTVQIPSSANRSFAQQGTGTRTQAPSRAAQSNSPNN